MDRKQGSAGAARGRTGAGGKPVDDGTGAGGPRASGGGGGSGSGGGTRRRGAALESAILDAAWEVLVEHGYPGFTYEAVAARAGTSRPVLYRRWPRREDLLLATLTTFWRPMEVPDTGSLREDALGFLRTVLASRAQMVTMMSVQLVDYFRDTGTGFSQLREALIPPGGATPFETIVARAVARGELPGVPRPSRVVDLPFDLLRHDMLITTREVDEASLAEIVDEAWLPLLAPPTDPA